MRPVRVLLWAAVAALLGVAGYAGWATVSAVLDAFDYRSRTGEGVAFVWAWLPFVITVVAALAASLIAMLLMRLPRAVTDAS